MAICRIIDTSATPAEYEQVRSKLGIEHEHLPPGGLVHIATLTDDGTVRIVELWESREQAERWTEQVRAARQELGIGPASPPPIAYYDVHRVMTVQEVPSANKPIEGVGTSIAS